MRGRGGEGDLHVARRHDNRRIGNEIRKWLTRVARDKLIAEQLEPIIGDQRGTMLLLDEIPVIFDAGADRLRKFQAPEAIRDEAAFAACVTKPPSTKIAGTFVSAEPRSARA